VLPRRLLDEVAIDIVLAVLKRLQAAVREALRKAVPALAAAVGGELPLRVA